MAMTSSVKNSTIFFAAEFGGWQFLGRAAGTRVSSGRRTAQEEKMAKQTERESNECTTIQRFSYFL
jgi:hypothetical protein